MSRSVAPAEIDPFRQPRRRDGDIAAMNFHLRRLVIIAAASLAATNHGAGDTFQVSSVADTGAGSLRQAITDANNRAGADIINFSIPGGGIHVIKPRSPLPVITDRLLIDGYSQDGTKSNSLAEGNDAVLLIVLDGGLAGAG